MQIVKKAELKNLLFNRFLIFVYLLPFAGGFILYYFKSGFSVCLLMNLTELPCPACGLTRAFEELSHFHFFESFAYNPSVLIIAPILLLLIIFRVFPTDLKKKIYMFLLSNLKSLNLILTILFIIFFLTGFLRIADRFLHFLNFKDITPEKNLLMLFTGGL